MVIIFADSILQDDNFTFCISMLTDNSKKIESKIQRGLCWIYLGMIQSTLLRPVGNVDPVEETNVKVDNIKREVSR